MTANKKMQAYVSRGDIILYANSPHIGRLLTAGRAYALTLEEAKTLIRDLRCCVRGAEKTSINFREILSKFAPKRRAKIEARGKELIQEYKPMRWIPVSERLPEKFGNYLVIGSPRRKVYTTYFYPKGYYGAQADAEWADEAEVTHWQPLPDPPKGEEK